jgi:NTP pyrophosphatase (non-canonical NTP hydrolase)
MDASTNIEDLKKMVKKFCSERDWDQFHSAKDLAIGLSTESAELLELFRFKSEQEVKDRVSDPSDRRKVENELADVFFFVLRFAQMNGMDLSECLRSKMELNAQKYPISKSKGSNKKYNEE